MMMVLIAFLMSMLLRDERCAPVRQYNTIVLLDRALFGKLPFIEVLSGL